ncbi:MAG: hypothetical protein Q8L35_07330 [Actinomycetota bacterium]|nr:hypothetical protein [Actinomycetota bacterium]
MKATALRFWPKSQHKLAGYAKTAEEREVSLVKEHPKLLALLAVSFLFGFGFLFAAGYFIYVWFRNRASLKS